MVNLALEGVRDGKKSDDMTLAGPQSVLDLSHSDSYTEQDLEDSPTIIASATAVSSGNKVLKEPPDDRSDGWELELELELDGFCPDADVDLENIEEDLANVLGGDDIDNLLPS